VDKGAVTFDRFKRIQLGAAWSAMPAYKCHQQGSISLRRVTPSWLRTFFLTRR